MALIVEDGTGLATAESYASVAEASAYHSARGNAAWTALASDVVREQCLRKATDYMLQNYRASWKGCRTSGTQALDWPRYDVYLDSISVATRYTAAQFAVASNIVPTEVKNACAELALKASTDELNPDLDRGVVSETVGPISTTYDTNSPQQRRYRAIDMLLRPLLAGNGVSVGVIRS